MNAKTFTEYITKTPVGIFDLNFENYFVIPKHTLLDVKSLWAVGDKQYIKGWVSPGPESKRIGRMVEDESNLSSHETAWSGFWIEKSNFLVISLTSVENFSLTNLRTSSTITKWRNAKPLFRRDKKSYLMVPH